jgi:uncharacterized protein
MKVDTYPDAAAFLAAAGSALTDNEAANSLMLGICQRLMDKPDWLKKQPFLATVSDERGLVLAAMMTPPHNVVLATFGVDTGSAVSSLVSRLRDTGWPLPGVLGPAVAAQAFATAWVAEAGGAFRLRMAQRVHELRAVALPERTAPGSLRAATTGDLELVYAWSLAFFAEALGEEDTERVRLMAEERVAEGDFFLWEDGEPVSMAMRTRPAGRGISVTAVYTPPEQRRKGYATACVAALSRQLLAAGYDYCALFTDLANPTSNDIYYQIGYLPVADFDEYRFEGGESWPD